MVEVRKFPPSKYFFLNYCTLTKHALQLGNYYHHAFPHKVLPSSVWFLWNFVKGLITKKWILSRFFGQIYRARGDHVRDFVPIGLIVTLFPVISVLKRNSFIHLHFITRKTCLFLRTRDVPNFTSASRFTIVLIIQLCGVFVLSCIVCASVFSSFFSFDIRNFFSSWLFV